MGHCLPAIKPHYNTKNRIFWYVWSTTENLGEEDVFEQNAPESEEAKPESKDDPDEAQSSKEAPEMEKPAESTGAGKASADATQQ